MKRNVSKDSIQSQLSVCSEFSTSQSEADHGSPTSLPASTSSNSANTGSGLSLIRRVRKSMSRDSALAHAAVQAASSKEFSDKHTPATLRSQSAIDDVTKIGDGASDDSFFNVDLFPNSWQQVSVVWCLRG